MAGVEWESLAPDRGDRLRSQTVAMPKETGPSALAPSSGPCLCLFLSVAPALLVRVQKHIKAVLYNKVKDSWPISGEGKHRCLSRRGNAGVLQAQGGGRPRGRQAQGGGRHREDCNCCCFFFF